MTFFDADPNRNINLMFAKRFYDDKKSKIRWIYLNTNMYIYQICEYDFVCYPKSLKLVCF